MAFSRQFETYQHYKGGIYLLLTEGLHTETEETLVIYVCAVSGRTFCRPKEMFFGDVQKENYTGPRFRKLPKTDDKTTCKKLK